MHVQLGIKPFLHARKGCIMVSLDNYSQEKIKKMPLIELAKIMMLQEKKAMKFSEAFTRVADLKGLSEGERQSKIGQFYTDLNADGSFVSSGSNMWGLKRWYRDEQKAEEEEAPVLGNIRRKRRRTSEEDYFDEEFEMIDVNIDDMDVDYDDEDDLDFEEDFDEEFDEDFDEREEE